MQCSICNVQTKVIQTYAVDGKVYRMRRCPNCNKLLYSIEAPADRFEVSEKLYQQRKNFPSVQKRRKSKESL